MKQMARISMDDYRIDEDIAAVNPWISSFVSRQTCSQPIFRDVKVVGEWTRCMQWWEEDGEEQRLFPLATNPIPENIYKALHPSEWRILAVRIGANGYEIEYNLRVVMPDISFGTTPVSGLVAPTQQGRIIKPMGFFHPMCARAFGVRCA